MAIRENRSRAAAYRHELKYEVLQWQPGDVIFPLASNKVLGNANKQFSSYYAENDCAEFLTLFLP